jgi:hypothetical protein
MQPIFACDGGLILFRASIWLLAQSVELLTAQNEATRMVVDAMVEGINGLLRIVTSHEKRLSELEGS